MKARNTWVICNEYGGRLFPAIDRNLNYIRGSMVCFGSERLAKDYCRIMRKDGYRLLTSKLKDTE